MKIAFQEISSIASLSQEFKKIILMNGKELYPHDIPEHEYEELALNLIEEKNTRGKNWKVISTSKEGKHIPHTKKILQHVTRSRNLLYITADALHVLHHSSHTLNEYSEIIPLTSEIRSEIQKEIHKHASEGNSVIGISIKRIESSSHDTKNIHNGIFIGIALYEYSVQEKSRLTIDDFHTQDIKVILFSNEILPTCKAIARQLGINASQDFCITSDHLQSMNDEEVISHIPHITIVAEIKSLDKTRLTRLFEDQGYELIG